MKFAVHLYQLLLLSYITWSSANYASLCDSVFCKVLSKSMTKVSELRQAVDKGSIVESLGNQAEQICNQAIEDFTLEAPLPDDDETGGEAGEGAETGTGNKRNEEIYDSKVEELERVLDGSLQGIYLKQLSLYRDKALRSFTSSIRTSSSGSGSGGVEAGVGSDYEAMMKADEIFRQGVETGMRPGADWDSTRESQFLKSAFSEVLTRSKKTAEVQQQATRSNQQAMQYLQMQQQQLQAIQQQMQGSNSPWNIGLAYRIPDTSINLSCNYQQGKGSVQVSCVPDEAMSLLGPNGFVNGVTPGNVGISFNINI